MGLGGHSHRCCSKQKVKKGLWSPEEDDKLLTHITAHGHGSWSSVPKLAGLQRCGKSCRLRWINYLRPDLRRGSFSEEEEQIVIDVHRILGNRWAQIAKHLPGRTDNEVKNYWNSCIKKKLMSQGLDPMTHNLMPSHRRAAHFKTTACNLQQQQHQQRPATNYNKFTISNSPSSPSPSPPPSSVVSNVSMDTIVRPHHVLTLPPAPTITQSSSFLDQPVMASDQYQNSNVLVWSNTGNCCVQNTQDYNYHYSTNHFPYYVSSSSIDHQNNATVPISSSSSRSSSSFMRMNPPGFGLSTIDDHEKNYRTGAATAHDSDHINAPMQQRQEQAGDKEKMSTIRDQAPQIDKSDEADIVGFSFGSARLFDDDYEIVDSTLLAAGAMCRDFSSISMDDFSWNF